MRITLYAKNLIITAALQNYIERKILKPIRRFFKGVVSKELPILDLEFSRITKHHRKGKVFHAEANLSLDGKIFRAEVNDENIRSAIDQLEEELEKEISVFRGRGEALLKRRGRRFKKDLHFHPAARFFRKGRLREEGI